MKSGKSVLLSYLPKNVILLQQLTLNIKQQGNFPDDPGEESTFQYKEDGFNP